jgi:hypothetical protein
MLNIKPLIFKDKDFNNPEFHCEVNKVYQKNISLEICILPNELTQY